MNELTKLEYVELLASLSRVPKSARGSAWTKSVYFLKHVIEGTNNIAIPLASDLFHYSVSCSVCKRPIAIDEDFVFKAMTATHKHYDCFMRSDDA